MNAGADPANPQSWNEYSYVANNPLTLTDPSGMDAGCDPSEGCISIGSGGICLLFCGGHSEDRQPPIYTPPDTQNTTDPNPPAGDPSPTNDPFSGETAGIPNWLARSALYGPLNIAQLLGVPNAPGLIIDNFHEDQNGNVLSDVPNEQLCGVFSVCAYWNAGMRRLLSVWRDDLLRRRDNIMEPETLPFRSAC